MPRFDRLDEAVVALEEDALVVVLLDQGKAAPVRAQAGEALDELRFGQPQMSGQGRHFVAVEADIAGPAATGRAALADIAEAGRGIRHRGGRRAAVAAGSGEMSDRFEAFQEKWKALDDSRRRMNSNFPESIGDFPA